MTEDGVDCMLCKSFSGNSSDTKTVLKDRYIPKSLHRGV